MMKDSGIQGSSEPGPRAQSERKCSLFNLTLFSYYISSLLLFLVSVFPSSGRAIFFFFFFFMSACTAALEQELLVGDGWMDGSSEEEEEGKRMGRELNVYVGVCACMCELLGCRDAVWTWVCSFSYCRQRYHDPQTPHVWTQWFKSVFRTEIKKSSVFPQILLPHHPIHNNSSWIWFSKNTQEVPRLNNTSFLFFDSPRGLFTGFWQNSVIHNYKHCYKDGLYLF